MNRIKTWAPNELSQVRRLAISWYNKFGRELPWRQTADPYSIWVSEIMLQQTQVATVIDYYHRFLQSFPNANALANAELDQVYQHWAGLGYYRRARQLHAAAVLVRDEYGGIFPTKHAEVLSLPGIGRYTANAILTFSQDARLPIVEANTQRLYARLMHLDEDLSGKKAQERLWKFADEVLPVRRGSGTLNQALMDIGSQICLPKNPTCLICPLRDLCPTRMSGSQDRIPAPKKPKEYMDLREAALVIRDAENRLLMRRCEEGERWAGLWDMPRFDITDCTSEKQTIDSLRRQFLARFGMQLDIGLPIHRLKHAVTRYRISLTAYEAMVISDRSKAKQSATNMLWANNTKMDQLALSSSGKRLWEKLRQT